MCPIRRTPSPIKSVRPHSKKGVPKTPTPNQKGKYLENAITGIEKLILSSVRGLELSKIEIIPNYKKIPGYEIDLYVKITDTHGYDSIFIFEAKNWKKVVQRKHISDFIDKIRVTSAQWGYFIGKSFSKGALERIKDEPRVKSVLASHTPYLPFVYCEGSTLDAESSRIVALIADGKSIEVDKDFVLTVEGRELKEIQLIDSYIQIKKNLSDHNNTVDLLFHTQPILINGRAVKNVDSFEVVTHYKPLETRIVRDQFFDVQERGTFYPMHLYDGETRVLEITITSVRSEGKFHFSFCLNPNFGVMTYDTLLTLKWLESLDNS